MKICTKCHKTLDESEFYKFHKGKDGLKAECKSCQRGYMVRYFRSWGNEGAMGRFRRLRQHARTKGIAFTINPHTYIGWFRLQGMNCHYCDSPLTHTRGHKHQLSDWSFDRKDTTRGYSLDNITLSCRRCNVIKGNWFTESQMLEIANKYLKGR